MTNLVVGSPPRGRDYFGQEELIENIWAKLERDNILLTAPRRFGKTGTMFRLLDEPHVPFRPVYVNVEPIMSAANFMIDLIAVLLRDRHFCRIVNSLWAETMSFGRFLRNLPSSIDIGGLKVELREQTDVQENWMLYGDRVTSLLTKDGPPLLLLIDEFPVMIETISRRDSQEAEQLLRWFRSTRQAPETQIRFVVGGSINLITTLESMGLVDTVNDFYIQKLKPFDLETAKQFIEAASFTRHINLSPAVMDEILTLVGTPIPYLLAVFLTAIFDRLQTRKTDASTDTVLAAFEEDLLGGATSVTFKHYRSRIDEYYPGPEGQTAKAILNLLSRTDSTMERQTLYQIFLKTSNMQHSTSAEEAFLVLMNKLKNDFYISLQDGRYGFFSRVLKLWWKTHYGFQGE